MSDNLIDPLLVLLRRHEAANAAYDALSSNASEAEQGHLYGVYSQTMHAFIDRAPAATTAGGAVAALTSSMTKPWAPRMPSACSFASLFRPRVTTSSAPPRDDQRRRLGR
jgi:hypothetical protein